MRFMVIVKASRDSEAGTLPDRKEFEAMDRYNEELLEAGVWIAGEGLQASSKGARVRFERGKKHTVIDGPFTEAKELVAGFWIWQLRNKDEAIEWVKRAPFEEGTEIEIRQMFETEDLGDVLTPEMKAQDDRARAASGLAERR